MKHTDIQRDRQNQKINGQVEGTKNTEKEFFVSDDVEGSGGDFP